MVEFRATTIVAVRRSNDDVCIAGDGQVTMGETAIMKAGAKKVQKIFHNQVLVGFAGSVADAFSLREKFEKKLEEHGGNLKRAAVALAQLWRGDQQMRSGCRVVNYNQTFGLDKDVISSKPYKLDW